MKTPFVSSNSRNTSFTNFQNHFTSFQNPGFFIENFESKKLLKIHIRNIALIRDENSLHVRKVFQHGEGLFIP